MQKLPLWISLSLDNCICTPVARLSSTPYTWLTRDQKVVFQDCQFCLQCEIVDRKSQLGVFQSLVSDKVARLGYKKHCNYAQNFFLWKNSRLHDSQRSQPLSSHKTKRVRRQSTKFCDPGRTWPVNTSSENTEKEKKNKLINLRFSEKGTKIWRNLPFSFDIS